MKQQNKKLNDIKKKKNKKSKNIGMKIIAIFMLLLMVASLIASIVAYI